MTYRADIQILRGLAVLLVVLFHLDFELVKSGFLGVDVFFVISGFLMAILYQPQNSLDFFVRRSQRLLPAYYVTLLATLCIGFIVTTPSEFGQIQSQSGFASIFASNVGFWMQNSYFSKAEFNPLLHMWSLGIEIQFYILVPVIVWMLNRHRLVLPLLFVGSLFACLFVTTISPKTSFFLLPFRIWEFLAGVAIARWSGSQSLSFLSGKLVGLCSVLALLALMLLPIDGTSRSVIYGHPGVVSMVVVILSALILLFGLPELVTQSPVGLLFERIGKYSYSIYLAHFPIIVFYLYQPFEGTILKPGGVTDLLLLVVLISIGALALYHLVENRYRKTVFSLRIPLVASLVVTVLSVSLVPIQRQLFDERENKIFAAWEDRVEYRCGKLKRIISPGEISCELHPPSKETQKVVMLIGNSHADSIKHSFVNVAKENDIAVRFVVSNMPLLKGGPGAEKLIGDAVKHSVNELILHYSPKKLENLAIADLTELARQKGIRVKVILPIPVWDVHIPAAVYRHVSQGEALPVKSYQGYMRDTQTLVEKLLDETQGDIQTYDVGSYFCRTNCDFMSSEWDLYYFDDSHLTLTGSRLLEPLFEDVFSIKLTSTAARFPAAENRL